MITIASRDATAAWLAASHGTYHNDSGGDKPPAKLPPRVRVDVQHFLNVRWEFLIAWNSVNARRVQDTSVQQLLGARMTSRVAWRRSYNCSWGKRPVESWDGSRVFHQAACDGNVRHSTIQLVRLWTVRALQNVRYLHCCFLLTEKRKFSQKNGRYLSQIECHGFSAVFLRLYCASFAAALLRTALAVSAMHLHCIK